MKHALRKQFVTLVISLIACILSVGALWRVALVMHVRAQSVVDAHQELANYESNKDMLAQEASKLQAISARADTLEGYRISDDTLPTLLTGIETLAKRRGITFSVTTVTTPGDGAQKKLVIGISATGAQSDIDHFLLDLQHQSYQVAITSFSYYREQSTAPNPPWDLLATLQIMSY